MHFKFDGSNITQNIWDGATNINGTERKQLEEHFASNQSKLATGQ